MIFIWLKQLHRLTQTNSKELPPYAAQLLEHVSLHSVMFICMICTWPCGRNNYTEVFSQSLLEHNFKRIVIIMLYSCSNMFIHVRTCSSTWCVLDHVIETTTQSCLDKLTLNNIISWENLPRKFLKEFKYSKCSRMFLKFEKCWLIKNFTGCFHLRPHNTSV